MLQDFFMQQIVPVMMMDSKGAQSLLETELGRATSKADGAAIAAAVESLGFKNGTFEDAVDWGVFSNSLTDAKKKLENLKEELSKLPVARPKGRPFGSCNKKRPKDDVTDAVEGEQPQKKQKSKSKEQQGKSKKQKDDGEIEPSDDSKGSKAENKSSDGGPNSGDPYEDLEEATNPNKTQMIPLYTKCLIVKYAKELDSAGNTKSIEKEVMLKFQRYFWNGDKSRYKTGLLAKWIKTLGFVLNWGFQTNCFTEGILFGWLSKG